VARLPPSPQVPFAGHSMPIMYKDSIMEATKQGITLVHVRAQLEQIHDTFMS